LLPNGLGQRFENVPRLSTLYQLRHTVGAYLTVEARSCKPAHGHATATWAVCCLQFLFMCRSTGRQARREARTLIAGGDAWRNARLAAAALGCQPRRMSDDPDDTRTCLVG
jgi:hypothetical protein